MATSNERLRGSGKVSENMDTDTMYVFFAAISNTYYSGLITAAQSMLHCHCLKYFECIVSSTKPEDEMDLL